LVTRAEAEKMIMELRGRFPGERIYLDALQQQMHQMFPDYCNSKEAVYMQVDGGEC